MHLLSENTPRDLVKSMKKKGLSVMKNSVKNVKDFDYVKNMKKVRDFDYVEKGKDVVKKGKGFVKRVEDLMVKDLSKK
jgi:ABC-type uncharacterized transport system substrate-binding protein